MTIVYALTPKLRMRLKKPLGTLIRGSLNETIQELEHFLRKEKSIRLISVGDIISRSLIENNIIPDLIIVDNKTMRRRTKPISVITEKSVKVTNPPATITSQAISAIQDSLGNNNNCTKLTVRGEEDLLTLVAIMFAPENAIVAYGQPNEGIVIVKVTPAKKAEIAAILKEMETARKAK
jgi:uncharacterized protein (UPF0218 family)